MIPGSDATCTEISHFSFNVMLLILMLLASSSFILLSFTRKHKNN